ncbi:MAG TPA: hypothetical protein VFR81_06140 [Longimicrobium sp.]|nr:hypothetical protein [Longimicrobium sp.]
MRRRALAAAVLALAAGACDRGGADVAKEIPAAATLERLPAAVDSSDRAGIALRVRKEAEGAYVLHGRTEAVDALEVTVEDGERVLFGPAPVEVTAGSFRTEMRIEPTDSSVVYVYLGDPAGRRQWRVPVPRRMREVAFGSRLDVDDVPSEAN